MNGGKVPNSSCFQHVFLFLNLLQIGAQVLYEHTSGAQWLQMDQPRFGHVVLLFRPV